MRRKIAVIADRKMVSGLTGRHIVAESNMGQSILNQRKWYKSNPISWSNECSSGVSKTRTYSLCEHTAKLQTVFMRAWLEIKWKTIKKTSTNDYHNAASHQLRLFEGSLHNLISLFFIDVSTSLSINIPFPASVSRHSIFSSTRKCRPLHMDYMAKDKSPEYIYTVFSKL